MMQLLCNGVVLDLYENTGLQMKDDNPLFAFDKIACERTTNFKLPATPTNDRVLSLARVPAYKGDGMRRKFSAQLQACTVVKDGYLYVSNFDGKDYNAIFVTGELLGLQQIKDLGKLCEIMEYPETVSASYAVKPANDATFKTSVFDVYRYEGSEGVTIFPSINVGKLIDKICAHIGVQCATPGKTYEMRLACPSLRVPEKIEGAHIKSTRTGGDPYNTIFADLLARGIIEERVLVARRTLVWHNGYSVTGDVLETQTYDVNVAHFRTLDSIAITFPEDFPERLFLCYMNPLVSGQCVFLGDYSFTRPTPTTTGEAGVVVSGEPLAGRTVEIPAGTSFILVREDGYAQPSGQNDYQCNAVQTYWGDDAIPAVLVTRGWDFVNGLQYDYEVDVDFNEDGATVYRMQDNLPDITFVELLKAVAAELGLVLRYSDAEGLTLDALPIDTYSVLEVGQIMKRGEVTRTFADYAQRNAVSYKEDDVFPNNETPAIYTIDNDNISEEKDLQVLPWTDGGQYISSAGVVVWDKPGRSEFLEIRYNAGGIAALRASISKNESIQRLCDASTQIKIESRMPLLQYERLKPETGLLVDNLTYLWTDKQWQKDIAKLTLAQYAKAVAPAPPGPLPTGYQQVEWLKANGLTIIDTGITPNENIECTMLATILSVNNNNGIFGCEWNGSGFVCISVLGEWIRWHPINDRQPQKQLNIRNAEFPMYAEITCSEKIFKVNDFEMNFDYSGTLTSTIKLFTIGGYYPANFDAHEFIIKENGVVIMDFIPCYRKADNVAGMYDIVNNVFYTNAGSGEFIVGPDVN